MRKFLKNHRPFIFFLFAVSAFTACNPERVHYTNELKQEMSDSKIKRITNADLIETMDVLGAKISAALQKDLTTQLQKATSPVQQAEVCNVRNLSRTRAIEKEYGVDLRLLGTQAIQDKAINPKEREILDAYLYNAKQKLAPISNIQKLSDTSYVYNLALPADSPICQACFGKQDIPFAVWHIGFSKREVIRHMNSSARKSRKK